MAKRKGIRLSALVILTVMFIVLLAACTVKKGDTEQDSKIQNEPKTDHIIMTFQTMHYSGLEDLDKVVEAINAITVPEIGVEVEFRIIDAVDSFTQYFLWLSNNETVDLMVLNYQDITAYISKGMLLPLDELLSKLAPDINSIMEEGYHLTEGNTAGGKVYGVAMVPFCSGSGGGIWIPKRYMDEAGENYDPKHVYSLDELSRIFKKLKELYPNSYPLGQITAGNTYSTMNFYKGQVDGLGGDISTGAILSSDSTKVSNLFLSNLYQDFLNHLREWYMAGYIYPDAAITETNIIELISSGLVMSYPIISIPGFAAEAFLDENIVCLRTSEVLLMPGYVKSSCWTIPVTSSNPEAAMKFLNMMYGDERISNLLQWGIEGEHYVVTDEENRLAAFPEGINSTNNKYYNPLGLYGDARNNYFNGSIKLKEEQQKYTEEAIENQRGFKGFAYSTAKVDKKISAIQKVVEKYVPVLESGRVDISIYYEEFLRELEHAGIDEVIADKQAQLDEWLLNTTSPK